jgi:AmmeMemoRadiSam system protein B
MWYPLKKEELSELLSSYLDEELAKRHKQKPAKGIIVPHAGYEFSGKVASRAYPYLKGARKVIIFSPNHYFPNRGLITHNESFWQTPLGKIKISASELRKANLTEEHAIDNQIPFLQKLNFEEILPIVVGQITQEEARVYAKQFEDFKGVFIFSSDLSHFLDYDSAKARDSKTIKVIENLDIKNTDKIDACGIYPLMIFLELSKLKGWKPRLIEYKNSGDINGSKDKVVGYAAFVF